jgi:hypothetical protein
MDKVHLRRLKELEQENTRLKKIVAQQILGAPHNDHVSRGTIDSTAAHAQLEIIAGVVTRFRSHATNRF